MLALRVGKRLSTAKDATMDDTTLAQLAAEFEAALKVARDTERNSAMGTNAEIRRVNRLIGKARKAADAYENARRATR
jgi:hypothetical protein